MRTAGLANILLLVSGSVLGLPQEYGQNDDSTDNSGGGGASVSGDFWWQQGNAFAGASGDSVQDTLGSIFSQVVNAFNTTVTELTSQLNPGSITPQQSEYCELGKGCVPWQLCPNGIITQGSNVVPGLIPYPEGAGYTGCGDVTGNVCCGIPQDILDQQQQQSNAGTYTTAGSGDLTSQCASNQECVPYFQCHNGFINTDGSGLLDVRTKPKATCSHPDYTDIPALCCNIPGAPEPVSSTYAPTAAPISSTYAPTSAPVTADTCDGYKVCVSQGLCDATGNVITDGGGLIDIRIVHKRCSIDGTEYGVCCTPPGAPPPTTPRPIPQLDICPNNSPCIAPSLCLGEALDSTESWTSYAPTGKIFSQCTVGGGYTSGPGVCCINPIPQIDICPKESLCIQPSLCLGKAFDSTGNWTSYASNGTIFYECVVGGDYDGGPGVCCINPIPQIEICPRESPCIAPSLCLGEALDSTGSWTSYAPTGKIFSECTAGDSYSVGPGVCCINPVVTPAPIKICPDGNKCVLQNQCNANGNIIADGSGLIDIRHKQIACILDEVSYETGVCCKPPEPIINVVDYCPGQSNCVHELLCIGKALDNGGSMVTYASGLLWSSCGLGGDSTIPGICCETTPPPVPATLQTCSQNQDCVDQSMCDANGNIVTDGGGLIDIRYKGVACYIDKTTYTEGVCCNKPPTIPVVNTCPGASFCVPELFCTGQILDSNNDMTPYSPGGTWSQCPVGNDASVMGVCCINPTISTVAPIIAANQCGRRNQEEVLDTRIQSTIAINEAQFGEFPWQAIIFFSNYTFKCGASLIGDRWLLTGGHCVNGFQPTDIQVRLGEWQVNSFDEPLPYKDIQIKGITVHPDFNPKNVQNNVAVLEMAEPVPIEYHINSICLPAPDQTFWNQRCIVSGWGKDSFEENYQHILKSVEVPTVDKSTCQALLRKTRLGKWFSLHESFMCAGGEENKDACKGDGGGPLACEDPVSGRYYLAGMTSWGIGCGNKDVPGVYADVQYFSTWIQGVIGGTLDQQQQLVDPEVETGSNPYGK